MSHEPLDALASLIGSARVDLTREKRTQSDLYVHLAARLDPGRSLQREVRLSSADIIDLLVDGRWGVEVKLNSARGAEVVDQLERYAAHERIHGLILATNRAVSLPERLNGKPVRQVSLGRAWL